MALRVNTARKVLLRSLSLSRRSLIPSQSGVKPLKLPYFSNKIVQQNPQFASFSTSCQLWSSSKDGEDDDDKKSLSDLAEGELAKLDESPGTTTIVDIPQALGGGGPGVPMTPQIPDNWPIVPVIAINKHPVFPKFIKIVEVNDEKLMAILRRKVRGLNQPYAGVFVKKNDDDASEVVKDLDDLYPIGSFVQIVEMQDLGNKLRMVVMAHRRISLQNQVVGEVTEEGTNEQNIEEDPSVLMANTENYEHEPYDTTDEVKALTQEIIKTIRDIIVSHFEKLLCTVIKLTFSFSR